MFLALCSSCRLCWSFLSRRDLTWLEEGTALRQLYPAPDSFCSRREGGYSSGGAITGSFEGVRGADALSTGTCSPELYELWPPWAASLVYWLLTVESDRCSGCEVARKALDAVKEEGLKNSSLHSQVTFDWIPSHLSPASLCEVRARDFLNLQNPSLPPTDRI